MFEWLFPKIYLEQATLFWGVDGAGAMDVSPAVSQDQETSQVLFCMLGETQLVLSYPHRQCCGSSGGIFLAMK